MAGWEQELAGLLRELGSRKKNPKPPPVFEQAHA